MFRAIIASVILLLFVPAVCAAGRDPSTANITPIMKSVDPDTAKAGSDATASGTNLNKEQIASVYLSQGDLMVKVKVVEQTDTDLKFTIPESAKPGRYGITVLTTGKEPRYIDEPLFISVE
ncbi:MAG TPA: IPT/TIG domain-containing protein [Bryobacteraceae bacterium]|nr:IPT/TIG domain-containing protein [Bryobacteraceae bacterium]